MRTARGRVKQNGVGSMAAGLVALRVCMGVGLGFGEQGGRHVARGARGRMDTWRVQGVGLASKHGDACTSWTELFTPPVASGPAQRQLHHSGPVLNGLQHVPCPRPHTGRTGDASCRPFHARHSRQPTPLPLDPVVPPHPPTRPKPHLPLRHERYSFLEALHRVAHALRGGGGGGLGLVQQGGLRAGTRAGHVGGGTKRCVLWQPGRV